MLSVLKILFKNRNAARVFKQPIPLNKALNACLKNSKPSEQRTLQHHPYFRRGFL